MPIIDIHRSIDAPIERVFDLCRSVDVHLAAASTTGEKSIAGVTTGLLELGDEVTWSARHLGCRRTLTVRITEFDRPRHFRDSMVAGAFRRFDHDHYFTQAGRTTKTRDVFDFESPLGPIGRIADALVVTRHMRRFLELRMDSIKSVAESEQWMQYLDQRAPRFS